MDVEMHFSLGLKRIALVKYNKHLQWTLSLFSEIFKVLPKATRCKESMLIVILFILNTIFLKLLRKMAWICTHWINGSPYCSSLMWKKRTEDYIMAAKHNLRTHFPGELCTTPNRRGGLNRKAGFNKWSQVTINCSLQNEALGVYIWRVTY